MDADSVRAPRCSSAPPIPKRLQSIIQPKNTPLKKLAKDDIEVKNSGDNSKSK